MDVAEHLGPGLWYSIHFMAVRVGELITKADFSNYITELSLHFPCHRCGEHLRDYLLQHPLTDYWNLELGMFRWSVELHNHVNIQLRKPTHSWQEVLQQYQGLQVCSSCGSGDPADASNALQWMDTQVTDSSPVIIIPPPKAASSTTVPTELLDYLAQQRRSHGH